MLKKSHSFLEIVMKTEFKKESSPLSATTQICFAVHLRYKVFNQICT